MDARRERMDRVAVLYAEITAGTREFLRALASCDRHRDWAEEGFASCADWLAWRIGVTRNTASEKVRAARALEELPLISEAMARGELSFSKVRALTRAATRDNEAELLAYARSASTAGLERLVRGWKTLGRLEEAKAERLRHRLRRFSVFPSEDGTYVVRGVVSPEVGAMLMRAIEAASDALYRACPGDDDAPEPEQLRADALGLVAERALAAGFGLPAEGAAREDAATREGATREGATREGATRERATREGATRERATSAAGTTEGPTGRGPEEHRAAQERTAVQEGIPTPISGSRAERYQVVLHLEPSTLREHGEHGMSELEDGTRVTAETARRLACDAAVVEVHRGPDGSVLDVGRRSRSVSPSLRRALETRDRGCRFPGCGLRFTDAHHIEHWADGGETSLRNTVLLCRRHHRLVHEDGYRICMDKDGQVVFFSPRGRVIAAVARPTRVASAGLVRRNRERGVEPDWRTGLPPCRHEDEIPPDVEIAALEAMEQVLGGALEDVAQVPRARRQPRDLRSWRSMGASRAG